MGREGIGVGLMANLTDKQQIAVEYFVEWIHKFEAISIRCYENKMPLLGKECQRISKTLNETMKLQVRVLKEPEAFLFKEEKEIKK